MGKVKGKKMPPPHTQKGEAEEFWKILPDGNNNCRCDRRIVRDMSAIGKQGANYMFSRIQFQFLTGGAITHVNVVGVFTDSLA